MPTYSYKVTITGTGTLDVIKVKLADKNIPMTSNDSKAWKSGTVTLTFDGKLKGSLEIYATSGTAWTVAINETTNETTVFSKAGSTSENISKIPVNVNPT